MRVVWRDSSQPVKYKQIKYRKYFINGSPQGWTTNIPGDSNIYSSHYCAQNAIDNYFGDFGQHGTEKRKKYGIQIIGKKDGETA